MFCVKKNSTLTTVTIVLLLKKMHISHFYIGLPAALAYSLSLSSAGILSSGIPESACSV